jgi:hypothetical protein
MVVLNHFTEKSFQRKFLTEKPFARTPFARMPFDRKNIWPNRRLTKGRLTESSFYRIKSFGRKQNFSKGRLT